MPLPRKNRWARPGPTRGLGMSLVDVRAGVAQADDRPAGRDQVGAGVASVARRWRRRRRRRPSGRSVPVGSAAPTAMTYGSMAGLVSAGRRRRRRCRRRPPRRCPCASRPRPRRRAGRAGSSWIESVPKDRLSTRMFRPGSLRCCTTQSMAAMTWDTSVAPSAAATLTLTSVRVRARPRRSTSSRSRCRPRPPGRGRR